MTVKELIFNAVDEYQKEKGIESTKEVYEFISDVENNGLNNIKNFDLVLKAMGLMIYKYGIKAENYLSIYNFLVQIVKEKQEHDPENKEEDGREKPKEGTTKEEVE